MNLTVAFIISLLLNIGLIYLFIRSFFSNKSKDSELAKSQKKLDIYENSREEHNANIKKLKNKKSANSFDDVLNDFDSRAAGRKKIRKNKQ
jgi:hypothetical protein